MLMCNKRLVLIVVFVLGLAVLSGCAKVGGERWCDQLEDKPKGNWTMNEAGDYAKHCIIK